MKIAPIPPARLDRLKPHIEPHLERLETASGGRFSRETLYAAAAAGEIILWVAHDGQTVFAVASSRVDRWPNGDCVGVIEFVAGRRPFMWARKGIRTITDDLRRRGCKRVEAVAGRWLKRFFEGYDVTHYRFDKDLI